MRAARHSDGEIKSTHLVFELGNTTITLRKALTMVGGFAFVALTGIII